MTKALQYLITEARALVNDHPCTQEHLWELVGGRPCPNGFFDCSQTVFQCARCGAYDYGDEGGPGHAECSTINPCSRAWGAVVEE